MWIIGNCRLTGLRNVPVSMAAHIRRGLAKSIFRWVDNSKDDRADPDTPLAALEWACEVCEWRERCFNSAVQDVSARNMERFLGTVKYRKGKADAKKRSDR